jgi:uroporphyrinogen-III decarboxylase
MADNAQLLAERKKRFSDCVALRKPDQVPIAPLADYFPARMAGHTVKEVMYDHQKMVDDWMLYHEKYKPDQSQNPFGLRGMAKIMDALDFQHLKWSGHGLPDDMPYQFVELEVMKASEYDHFIGDMTDFMIRKYIPRISKNLAGLEKLPAFNAQFSYLFGLYWPVAFLDPDVMKAVEHIHEAAKAGAEILSYSRKLGGMLVEAGFPPSSGGYTQAPFDTLSDVVRGTKGLMLDMRRCPDKIMAACEKLLPIMINTALRSVKMSGCPIVFIPLHKCMDTFMSQEQFERFYWPHLQELIQELVRNDITPWILMEGINDNRLKCFADVPEGKVVWHIEGSSLVKAKEAFRGRCCIRGSLPVSVLCMGTPEDVREECKKIMDLLKEDGGFIFDTGVSIGDARFENVDAMFDYVREHGVY